MKFNLIICLSQETWKDCQIRTVRIYSASAQFRIATWNCNLVMALFRFGVIVNTTLQYGYQNVISTRLCSQVRPKKKRRKLYVSALKNLRYGRSALIFYFTLFYMYTGFWAIFPPIFHNICIKATIFSSYCTIKCLWSGQKPRLGQETWRTQFFSGLKVVGFYGTSRIFHSFQAPPIKWVKSGWSLLAFRGHN